MDAFDVRDIRRGMDVYRRDGEWLGSVLRVESGGAPAGPLPTTYPMSTFAFDGERLGPASTHAIGNSGPDAQRRLASRQAGDSDRDAVRLVVGRWYGLLGRHAIDAGRIVNVSLEHIVVE